MDFQRHKPDSCTGCACFHHGTDFSVVSGTGSLGVMLVGEASGEMEAREQRPFIEFAPAGSVLERIIRRMGLSREQFSITNVLRCRPRNNFLEESPWEYSALNHCRPNLEKAIAERRPRCIVALGGVAMRELTGMAGEQQGISHLAGYVLPLVRYSEHSGPGLSSGTPQDIPVIGDFHPSYLRRGKASHQGVFSRILQRAINIAKDRKFYENWIWNVDEDEAKILNYNTHPSLEDGEAFLAYCLANPNLPISYDIETSESRSLDEDARVGFVSTALELVQFSIEGRGSIAFPWDRENLRDDWEVETIKSPFKEVIQKILHTSNVKVGHNVWGFDNKVLRAVGEREGLDLLPKGTIHDTLQMFHHWQPDLPAHLQFAASFVQFPFPWKHLAASNIEFYGCCDVDATLRLYKMLEATLKRDNLWGTDSLGYIGQVYQVRPILDRMEERGVPIDDEARLALDKEFDIAQEQLLREIQAMVPKECNRLHPKDGYKGVPPQVKPYLMDGGPTFSFTEEGEGGESYHYERREFAVAEVDAASGDPVLQKTLRWCRVYDFNPNSRPQVINYMKAKGHAVPKTREEDEEGNRKDTTAEKEMRRLANATGDVFYLKVVEYRGFTKLKGTYIEGFKPGPDGYVHPTFGFDTAIGQLTAKNPNSQNFPKLKPTPQLAKAMRGMIRAKSGKVIAEWDYRSFHVLTLGFLAEDPVWIRLARLDMHSFVAGHVLGLWDGPSILKETDEQLMARFKWLKSDPERKRVRDDQAKHGILGIGNGLMAKGLFERYMENFPPQRCKVCASTGRVAGARVGGTKKCEECRGTGTVSGRRVADTFHAALRLLAPRIFAYHRQERKLAHTAGDKGYYTPFGFARRFYEVYNFSKGWDPVRDPEPPGGDQAEQAVSYRHTNIAHCHLREVMKTLERLGLNEKYGLFNQIHDCLQFHFDESLLEEHFREIPPVLLEPSKILKNPVMPGGFYCDAEGSWGKVWNDMRDGSTIQTKEVTQ